MHSDFAVETVAEVENFVLALEVQVVGASYHC
jgi:hypothetical protein